ncbi:FAD-binding oxidoreductase [Rhizobium sp. L1K21]|uniref:NAD(P)/FAD-dependent oxidoreductase n=1 Tax=Rhizobium sp. L1K21 TaxID=2954933 RepID=UPI002092918A|nr:FAD-binding oxidoreductase [Rhizobium sp. L1K21]MCO6187089.1 FAD-binding oxidoreductase [Rhizobium sp. L1K21]
MTYQSPISPGISWYEASVAERPEYPTMDGARQCDVAVIGGGFTGLQAAYNLAKGGVDVTLIEAHRFGDGASGRNGGQLGTGQRWFPEEMEGTLGVARSRALFDLAENAKNYLMEFATTNGIDMDYMPGQMNVSHKKAYEAEYRESVEASASRYDYHHFAFMEREETQERVGSTLYHFGIRDTGTGHIHPMKLIVGLAKAAAEAGAHICENTPARKIERKADGFVIGTATGEISAKRVLIACNAYIEGLEPVTAAHVMPIRSFIGATEPLDNFPAVIPGGEAVADSRFVVRYFRKTRDNRLLFGGREAYTADHPSDMSVHIRRQITEIYPQLSKINITHAWGGSVGITLNRQPFAREVQPGLTSIGGYSGHGVMLANYCGKLYADAVLGTSSELDLIKSLKIKSFPGGARFRKPLLLLALSWYALLDKL